MSRFQGESFSGPKPDPKKSFFLLGKAGIPKNKHNMDKKSKSWSSYHLDVDADFYHKFPIIKDKTPQPIFKNFVLYFNGRGDDEYSFIHLAKLAILHGATIDRFINSKVTHVICINYIKEREKIKYVHPSWIMDCMEKQTTLKEDTYIVKHAK
jgi:hypothetical protein